jgi:hypothetical protein
MSEAQTYHDGLISQGYSAADAVSYTQQHFPDFGAAPAVVAAPAMQDSVVGRDLHTGNVVHHHHAAPAATTVQPVMQVAAPMLAGTTPYGAIVVTPEAKKKMMIVPWVGIGLIFLMLFMPFIQFEIAGETLGEDMSGFGIISEMGDEVGSSDGGGDGGGDDFDLGDIPPEWRFFGIALIMLMFSPIVFLLTGIISVAMLAMKKSPMAVGVLHLVFFGIFLLCSVIGSVDIFGFSLSVHGNVAGWGFFGAGAAGILLCLKM